MANRLRNDPIYRRRRRTAAAGAGLVIAAAVAAVIAASAGGGSPPAQTPKVTASSSRTKRYVIVRDGPHGTEPVPILMYHVIGSPPPGAPFPGLYVTQSLFAAQMHALQAAGYHAVTMNQMWDNWHRGTPLPKGKPVVVSFDNGYESQKLYALPVLRAMGWVAVENLQLSGPPFSQGGLNATEVRDLVKAGWELDTQGWNHADLVTLSPSELHFQVTVARQRIQRLYHVQAEWFCYPSGHYNAAVIAAVKAAGFRGSTTTWPGWANPTEDPYRLPRLRVLNGTSPATLLSLISGTHSNSPPGPAFS